MPASTSTLAGKKSDAADHVDEETFLRQVQEEVAGDASDQAVLEEGEGGDGQPKNKSLLGKIKRGLFRSQSKKANACSTKEEEEIKALVAACRSPCAAPGGGWANQNLEHAKRGRSVLSQLVRQLGTSLLRGQNIMNVSIPVACCQARSALEVGADATRLSHRFLSAAANNSDPVQRLALVLSGAVAALSLTADSFLKPLNPLLGETLQMEMDDGSRLFMEQTSHHPPVLAFLHEGPGGLYRLAGHQQARVAFGLNRLFFTSIGRYTAEFADGGRVTYDFPSDRIQNVFWGGMVHEVVGVQTFVDAANSLRARVAYDNPRGVRGVPSDWFEGAIETFDPANPDAEGCLLSELRGSWLGFCDVGGHRLWDITQHHPAQPTPPASTLPSDSRLRPDLRSLAAGDVKAAQAHKLQLEEQQRAEAKLRHARRPPQR